ASVASRAAWLLASELDTAALLRVAADERVDALDARGDRRGRRRIREADVLSLAGDAAAEVDVGQHGDPRLGQQPLAQRLRVRAAGDTARLGDVRPRVESAAGIAANDARHLVQQSDDQVAALEEACAHRIGGVL